MDLCVNKFACGGVPETKIMSYFSITGDRERIFCSAVIWTVSENPTEWWRWIISCDSEFTKIKTLPHTYNDTKINRKQRLRLPTNQRKKGPHTWLQESTCLDRCPAVGGVSIAGEEEVTGLHGPVELKGS